MSISRRHFLAGTAATALVASSLRVPVLWADANWRVRSDERILVVVQLSGGNDGINTVIPHSDDAYHRNRFATRIESNRVLKINDEIGFHPEMNGFLELSREERLCAIPGVGYSNPNRSHFESMDIWHSAGFQPPHRTGWLGRWIDSEAKKIEAAPAEAAIRAMRAMHIGDEPLPLALTGLNALVPSLKTIDSLRVISDDLVQEALRANHSAPQDVKSKQELLDFLQGARATALDAASKLQALDAKGLRASGGYDGSGLARKLASVAQLIKVGFGPRVYYVELAGFDTHSQQPEAHAALLGELSRSLRSFHKDLNDHGWGDRVLSFCFSEFGRRVKENGSRGTDHGTAGPVFLAGPPNLPKVSGSYPSLNDLEEGDLKYRIDFRRIYATLLENWLGVESAPILGESHETLDLLAETSSQKQD